MRRRDVLKGMAAAPFAAGTLAAPALGQNLDARTLRVIQGYSLSSIDPVWTTASASNDLAYLVYDQLFGMDADFNMQLQMAESWSSEDDARTHIITLRDGLKFHDGEPVRANDCVASINRWASKDSTGQALGQLIDKMDVMDDKTFRIRLTQPFAWLAHAIGKPNSSQCAIMTERFASMPSSEQVPEAIGSGPFRFLPEEFISGSQAIFTRFEDYVPRSEPVSGNAGGKVAQPTASNGPSSPIRPPPWRRCKPASRTIGPSPCPTWCRCCRPTRTWWCAAVSPAASPIRW